MSQSNATTGYLDSLWARRAAIEAKTKDQLVAKLKEHRLLSDDQIDQFKHDVAKYDQEHWMGGSHREFDQISLHFFIPPTIEWIANHAPNSRCIQIYEDVLSVIPDDEDDWDRPVRTEPTQREKPETVFSKSRAEPRLVKSNAELIDTLASVTDMEPRTAICIRGSIVFGDSISGGKHWTSGMLTGGTGFVSGGRLGRNHMLSDVPNHYVRDRLMDYIDTQLQDDAQLQGCTQPEVEEIQQRARLAVFSDLSPSEIEQYSALVAKWVKKNQPKTSEELIAIVAGDRPIRTESEKGRVLEQGYALEDVYQFVDLTPKPGFAKRTYGRPFSIGCSVVEPGLKKATPEERDLDPGTDIDRDCDQIRAMIAIFAFQKEWTVDEFRLVLGDCIERKDLSAFLRKDGPRKGKSSIYQLAWEFFKRRELLGLPLIKDAKNVPVLQEADTNIRKRLRPRANDGETREKRARAS
ncbi:hypothetical protein F4805DRAFT_437023 [Annulohypoxylon moriforme]|nr:hypothetical protein F4805DRAFT_437023 [Annulohypoxylon moriforme]